MATRTSNERDKFQSYIVRNLRYLTQLVANSAPLPSDEVRSQALHSLNYGLSNPDIWQTTRALVLALTPKMEQAGHRYDWLPYLEESTRLSEKLEDNPISAELHLQCGILHRLLGEFADAQIHFQSSIDLCQRFADRRNQARALNELAWVEYQQSKTELATQHVAQALALFALDDPERAMSFRVQGMIAIAHERWIEAEKLHRQAMALFEAQGEQRKAAWSLQNLAYALRGQERYPEAIDHFEQSAERLYKLGDLYHWSVVQMNIGICYRHLGRPEKALNYYNAARSIPLSLLDTFHTARLCVNTAIAHMLLSQFSEAENMFWEAIEQYKKNGSTAWKLNAMDGLAMTYLGWQKFERATEILQQALVDLPDIAHTPNYDYLKNSLHQHLEDAHKGLQENHSYASS